MTRVEELAAQVRALTPEEREELEMMLEEESGALQLSQEWEEEIARRIKELDSGKVRTYSHEEVMARLERRLSGGSWD